MGDSAIHALAGAVGGGVSMALTYPLVNLSTRAAVATKKENMNITQAIKKTIKTEGLAGLYSGLGSSLFGIAVTNGLFTVRVWLMGGIYYAFYEEARSTIIRRRNGSASTSALSTSEGILAGIIAGT